MGQPVLCQGPGPTASSTPVGPQVEQPTSHIYYSVLSTGRYPCPERPPCFLLSFRAGLSSRDTPVLLCPPQGVRPSVQAHHAGLGTV